MNIFDRYLTRLWNWVVLLVILSSTGLAQQRTCEGYEKGLFYYNLQDYEYALELFNSCIENNGASALAYYNRGKTYQQLGQSRKSLKDWEKAVALQPDLIQAYYALCEHYLAEKDFEKALEWITKGISKNEEEPYFYMLRGWVLMGMKKYKAAFGDFDYAIQLSPDYAKAYHNRGIARLKAQNIAEAHRKDIILARQDFATALQLDSTFSRNSIFNRNLGHIYYLFEDYDSALIYFDKTADLNQDDYWVHYYRAKIYEQNGRNAEAVVEYDLATEMFSEFGEAFLEKGRLQLMNQEYDEAEKTLKHAKDLGAYYLGAACYELARLNALTSRREQMITYLEMAKKAGYFDDKSAFAEMLRESAFEPFKDYLPLKEFKEKIRRS